MSARNLECLTCGWLYPVEDTTAPEDWVNHGDAREPSDISTTPPPCPSPNMGWVAE